MKCGLIELHSDNYDSLAKLTWDENKVPYAELHGYSVFSYVGEFKSGSGMGYQKVHYIKHVMETNPDIEWFWWTGTDTMITNFATRIEDRVLSSHHFIVCTDVNGLNADSLLIRNSAEGRNFVDDILSLEEEVSKYWDTEQRAISNLIGFPGTAEPGWPTGDKFLVNDKYKDVVKVMPQRYMNAFNYLLYHYQNHQDKLLFDGNWQLGDWLIHWPACSLEHRVQLAEFYKEHIVK